MPYTRMYYPRLKGRLIVVLLKGKIWRYAVGIIHELYDSVVIMEKGHLIASNGINRYRGAISLNAEVQIQHAWLLPR